MDFIPLAIWAVGFLISIKEEDESYNRKTDAEKKKIMAHIAPFYTIGLVAFTILGFISMANKGGS